MQQNLLVAALIGLVLGGLGGWLVGSRALSGGAESVDRGGGGAGADAILLEADRGTVRTPGADETRPDPVLVPVTVPQAQYDQLQQAHETLQAQVTELEAELARRPEAPARDPSAYRFGVTGSTPVYDAAKWDDLAEHVRALAEAMPALRDDILEDGRPSPAAIRSISKHNTPLATLAIGLASELGGSGPNGAYTHPAVIANMIRAALIQVGDPLSSEQEIAMRVLGEAWSREEGQRLETFRADAPAIARTVAEVDAKSRFLQGAKGILSGSQRSVLFNPATEDRVGLDLFSPALVYQLRDAARGQDREGLEAQLMEKFLGLAEVEMEDPSGLDWIVSRWVDDVPHALTPVKGLSEELIFPHLNQLQAEARAQTAATERLLASGALTGEQADALRENQLLLSLVTVEP